MQILNKLLAKGPVDFTAFWSDLQYNFRFGEEQILALSFTKNSHLNNQSIIFVYIPNQDI